MKKGKKKENQFAESSGLFPLASNPGTGAFDWGFLSVPVFSQVWCAGLCGHRYCPSSLDSLEGIWLEIFEPSVSLV
jgi:hypothetical protein